MGREMPSIDENRSETEGWKAYTFGPLEIDQKLTKPKDEKDELDLSSIWAAISAIAADITNLAIKTDILEQKIENLTTQITIINTADVEVIEGDAIVSVESPNNTFTIGAVVDDVTIGVNISNELEVIPEGFLSVCP